MGWNNYKDYSRYNRYNNAAARLSIMVCSLMFIIFSAVYLAVMQKDLLGAMHMSMSKGTSEFHVVPATIIIIVILMILKWSLNLIMRLKGAAHGLAYVPSFMGLITMTAFERDVYMNGASYAWWWIMPTVTALYVTIVALIRKNTRRTAQKPDMMGTLMWNVGTMLILSVATVCLGNTNRYLHNELRMETLMDKGNYNEVLKVAEKSLRTTKTMTALRMMAMTKEGIAGEMIFRYPQYYKENGLFFDYDSTKTLRYTNDSVYAMLGEKPEPGETKMDYLKRLAGKNDSCSFVKDYYMAGLMLDKNLKTLAAEIEKTKNDSLQRYLKEAAIMYKEMCPEWKFEIHDTDSICTKRRMEYVKRQKETYKSPNEERNKMRLEFGDTFWWYYDYQE
ncbi:hypothetical protein I6E11_06560 [Bacteroides caecigallinarum]|uniref:DUF6057 family protein n=1 Tax=Bacteroides caecigallinarum TaxID=1411144 RepID=UPI001F318E1F|nr:DUF6057 family protein [Bacteroides caecigallinarum]MCF2593461.1 hypothetical protein [Bacteroides caecigallinarum]